MINNHARDTDIRSLHPKVQSVFHDLAEALVSGYEAGLTQTRFQIFETFRTPSRQNYLLTKGTTKARGWQSPHQFGFAVDFVPVSFDPDGVIFSWSAEHDYNFLGKLALEHGLTRPISWDKCHIEHPLWHEHRKTIKKIYW